jgi:hypothetical protein
MLLAPLLPALLCGACRHGLRKLQKGHTQHAPDGRC